MAPTIISRKSKRFIPYSPLTPAPTDVPSLMEHINALRSVEPSPSFGRLSYGEVVSTKATDKVVKSTTFSGLIPKIVITPPSGKKEKVKPPVRGFTSRINFRKIRPPQKRDWVFRPTILAKWQESYWYQVDTNQRPHYFGRKLLRDMAAFKRLWCVEFNAPKPTPPPTYQGDLITFPAQATSVRGSGACLKAPKSSFGTSQLKKEGEIYISPRAPRNRSDEELSELVETALRLRAKLVEFSESRLPVLYKVDVWIVKKCNSIIREYNRIVKAHLKHLRPERKRFEMEQPEQDRVDMTCITAGDATLPQAPDPSEARIAKPIVRRRLLNMASSDSAETNPLLDTWVSLSVEDWSTNDVPQEQFWEYELPYTILEKKTLPQVLPFLAHQYTNCDMEVQVNLTGLAWARGMLIGSWYYHDDLDAQYGAHRRTRASMIQRDHFLINASIENSAVMRIPYSSHMSALPLTNRSDYATPGKLGTLIITPFNRLTVAESQLSSISFTVNFRFVQALLYGKTTVSIGVRPYVKETQMLPMVAMLAAQRLLNQNDSDPNRDKPPYQGPGMLMVPHATSNLAIGTNYVEHVQALRLNSAGQTPHPDLVTTCSTWQDIASRKGFVNTFTITRDMKAQTRIEAGSLDACPMQPLKCYTKYNILAQPVYNFPPIAVVSALFGKWRGPILVEYEFICSPAHHIEVLVAYVPSFLGEISYTQAIGCHHQVFKLRDGGPRSFEFEIPYVAPAPFWDRRFSTGVKVEEVDPPGRIHFFVRTPLVYTTVITKTIEVNVYMRAGEGFEVAIPVQPGVGLCFDPFGPHENPHDIIVTKPGYTYFNVDSWHSATNPTGNIAVLRYGNGSDHICQFLTKAGTNPETLCYYTLNNALFREQANSCKFQGRWVIDGTTYYIRPIFLIALTVGDDHGYQYMCAVQNLTQILYIFYDITEPVKKSPREFKLKLRKDPNYEYATVVTAPSQPIDADKSSKWYWNKSNLAQIDAQSLLRDMWKDQPFQEEWVKVTQSGDELLDNVGADCPTRYSSNVQGSSNSLYGETFFSIKDLCRRWHPFAVLNLSIDYSVSQPIGLAAFKIPILPAGLALNAQSNHAASLIRDGVIPIVNSFFRFFRGGLRFKFIFSTTPMVGTTFWVQHRPDRRVQDESITLLPKNAIDGLYCHNYASTIQCTTVNPTLTIEVPYYLRGPLGLLQRPNFNSTLSNEAFALGELVVGYTSFTARTVGKADVPVNILWSYADDFSPYVPIGFPAMVTLSQFEQNSSVGITEIEPSTSSNVKHFEMPLPMQSRFLECEDIGRKYNLIDHKIVFTPFNKFNRETKQPEVDDATFTSKMFKYLTGVDTTELRACFTELGNLGVKNLDLQGLLTNIASQICHIIATPTMTHVWIAFASIMVHLGILAFNQMTSLLELVRKASGAIGVANKRSEAYGEYSAISKIVTSLYMCIATFCDLKLSKFTPRDFDISKVVKIFQSNCKTANAVVDVLTMMFDTLRLIAKNVIYYATNVKNIVKWMLIKPDIVDEYVRRATEMLHPASEERVMTRPDGYLDVDIAYEQGASLLRDLMQIDDKNARKFSVVIDLQRKLGSLRDRAARMGCGASRRREPFCIHVTGPVGVGKSEITIGTIEDILAHAKIEYAGQSTWHLQHGMKYWDGLYNQPALMKDELCPMNDPTTMIEELTYFQMLMSCAPFIRPGAAIEDKGRVYAPEIVWLNSNVAYPTMDCVREKKSIFRRYSILWECDFTIECRKSVGDLVGTPAILLLKRMGVDVDNFEHLRFRRKVRPAEEYCTQWESWTSYKTMICTTYSEFIAHRKNQFHLVNLHLERKKNTGKIFDNVTEVEAAVTDRHSLDLSMAHTQMMDEISNNFVSQARIEEAGHVLTAPVEPIMTRLRKFFKPPSLINKVSEMPMPEPQANTLLSRSALQQEPEEVERMVANYLVTSRINKSKTLWFKDYKEGYTIKYKNSIYEKNNISSTCPHTFERMIDFVLDEADETFVHIMNYSERIPLACETGCVVQNPIVSNIVNLQLCDNSQYWKNVLYKYPRLFPRVVPSVQYDTKQIIKALHDSIDVRERSIRKWRIITRILTSLGTALAVIGTFWTLDRCLTGTSSTLHAHVAAGATSVAAGKVVKAMMSEVSPGQYSGKTMNGIKRTGVIRRVPQKMELKSSECDSVVAFVNDRTCYESKQFEMQTDIVGNIILNNTRFLIISGYDSSGTVIRRQCRVLGICDRYIVFPHHYIYEWNKMDYKDKVITIYHLGQFLEVEAFNWKELHQIEGTDLIIYRLSSKFPNFKDIRAHLATYDILEKGLSRKGQFFEVEPKLDSEKGQILNINPITMSHSDTQNIECNDLNIVLGDGIVYPEVHGAGKCGAVAVDMYNGKIVGMHVAGDSKEGMSSYLVRDWFDELTGVLTPTTLVDMYPQYVSLEAHPQVSLDGSFIEGGIVVKEVEHRETGKTALLPSEIAGVYPILTEPAILTDRDVRANGLSPMKLGVEKHGKPHTHIPPEYKEDAIRDYRELVFAKVVPVTTPVRPLTVEEAIVGNKDMLPNLKPIEMHTSEGFPFIAHRPKGSSDKSWLFNFQEVEGKRTLVGLHTELNEVLVKKQKMRETGIIPTTVFTDCLKDERKKSSKIRPDKTRIFSISPVDYTIQCRQYFAPFFQAFEQAGLEMEHAIGIAVQREDWSSLVKFMIRDNGGNPVHHACGDYTAFGDTLDSSLVEAALDIAIEWSEKWESKHMNADQVAQNKLVRRCLAAELKNATHLTFNVLVQTLCGMPSGCPLTVYLNTMVNSMYMRCAWLDIMTTNSLLDIKPLYHFAKYVRLVTYGDDVWLSISSAIIDIFNNQSIHAAFSGMGIIYTDILKDGKVRPYCKLDEVTFLKNSVKIHPTRDGKFLAALEEASVLDCVNWIHKCNDERAASLETSYSSVMLAYGHGPEFFNQHVKVLTEAWAAKGVAFRAKSWKDLDEQFYREDVPPTFLSNYPISATPHADRALLYARARAAYMKFLETRAI